jgi:ABC-type sugar transport system substrate-binding protein
MNRSRQLLGIAGAFALLLVTAAVASGSLGATKPGPVLENFTTVTGKGRWYAYDKKSCSFKTTANHPKVYKSVLRKQSGMKIVYTPEGTQAAFDKTLNDGTRQAATRAKMKFFQFTNEYPSTTLPLDAAHQAVAVKADVVVSANVAPDLYPAIQAIYKNACIPFINEFAVPGTVSVPSFQGDNYLTGSLAATAAAKIIKQRGWPASGIWIVSCADPAWTTKKGTVYDIARGFRETLAKLLTVPSGQVVQPDLVCTAELGPEKARQAMADWITAHPNAKYIAGIGPIDDLYGQGMATALRAANFGNHALIAGRGGGESSLKLIASGDPIFAVDANLLFAKWGNPLVAMAQQIALGQAVPAIVSPAVVAVTKENVSQYLP